SDHPSYDARLASKYKNVINETYEKVDFAIGEILKKTGNNSNVLIVSDHGFAPVYEFFYVNQWLRDIGLLKLKETGEHRWERAYPSLYKIMYKAGLERIGDRLPDAVKKIKIPALKRTKKQIPELIDWNNTRAYASPFGININLTGREPYGIVKPGSEYAEIKEQIRCERFKLSHVKGKGPLVGKVYFQNEIYNGPFVHNAADIFFFFNDPFFLQSSELNKSSIFERLNSKNFATANHRYSPDGIFISSGPDINLRGNLDMSSILDMAPTILYLMGSGIPKSMDGRILEEIVGSEKLQICPPKYTGKEMAESFKSASETKLEDEYVKEHLRRLGYLG
ncbi:MAG: alkaline phosphatase family protein, partial [Thermodesulfovibrionia bacterium]|nr:alkaline phosphatase family protein [Thermodesulfovibrionia bacterium]